MRSRLMAVLVCAVVTVVAGGGYAVADSLITGKKVKNGSLSGADVKNGSLTNTDLKKGTVKLDRLSKGTQRLIRKLGQQGPAGPAGPAGAPGKDGAPGQSLVANRITAPSTAFRGVRVVAVPRLAANSPGPSNTEGTELYDPVKLEAGTYKIEGVTQFFHFTGGGGVNEYGVTKVFMDGKPVGTTWSPDVPDDGNNAAQASAVTVVSVPEGGGTLSARAAIRGDTDVLATGSQATDSQAAAGQAGGQAGGNLIVTKIND